MLPIAEKLIVVTSFTVLTIAGLCFAETPAALVSNDRVPKTELVLVTEAGYFKTVLGLYNVSTFDAVTDGNAVHLIVGGKSSANAQAMSVRYTYSEDGGRHWNEPVELNPQLTEFLIAGRGNDIQLAVHGKSLVALWQVGGALPGMGPMVSFFSDDYGRTWQRGDNPAGNNEGSQAHMALTADQQGHFHAVWLEDPEETGIQSLRYTRSIDGGEQWHPAVTLDASTCSCCSNVLGLSLENELNVLYRDENPRDMALMQSTDGGISWQHAGTVGKFDWDFKGCPQVGGGLGFAQTDNANQLHSIVWTGREEKAGLYYLSSLDNGLSWSTPMKLGDTAIHGDIAAPNGQHVTAIWGEMEAEGIRLVYTLSDDGGVNWGTPKQLTRAEKQATHPKLIASPDGVLALWTEKPAKTPSYLAWQHIK